MIVVDASALAAFILKEPGWKELAPYMRESISVDHIIKEVGNAIWKAYVRELIDKETALKLVNVMMRLIGINVNVEREEEYLIEAFEIAVENNITLYDALYIALAKRRGLPLLTLDRRQREVAKRLGVEVIELNLG